MKLIVGLGNPGKDYENTRHNAGFMAIDALADKLGVTFKLEPKLKGMVATANANGNKVILLKPMTYMNLSGESVQATASYYKINIEDIIVISDDLDSHPGRVRVRASGSAGGHNGHKNIALHLGTEDYKRIKLGIGRSETISVIDWVLQKFNEEELALMSVAIEKTVAALEDFIADIPFNKISSFYSEK